MTLCAQRLSPEHVLEGFNWSYIKTVWSSNINLDTLFALLNFIDFYYYFQCSQFLKTLTTTRGLIFTRRVTIFNFSIESASHHKSETDLNWYSDSVQLRLRLRLHWLKGESASHPLLNEFIQMPPVLKCRTSDLVQYMFNYGI